MNIHGETVGASTDHLFPPESMRNASIHSLPTPSCSHEVKAITGRHAQYVDDTLLIPDHILYKLIRPKNYEKELREYLENHDE